MANIRLAGPRVHQQLGNDGVMNLPSLLFSKDIIHLHTYLLSESKFAENTQVSVSLMASKLIVMFPYLAQGHIIPFVALAKLIEKRNPGHTIAIVSTPLNIQNIRSSLPSNSNNILLKELPFRSSDHGLPPNTENTDSVPRHDLYKFNAASETLQPHFERFISDIIHKDGHPPLCIIADVMFAWTVGIAKKLGIFHASFTTCGAYGTAVFMSLHLNLPHRQTDSLEITLPGFPETFRLHRSQMPEHLRVADDTKPWATFFRRMMRLSLQSGAMICNTVEDIELLGLQALYNITGLQVLAIGPLFPLEASSPNRRIGKKPEIQAEACLEWLDSHPPGSVVYISFGSQNTITASQMMALARGLEASNKPFLWLVRPPVGFDLKEDFRDEWLPEGFEVRMSENRQGLLVRKWAPQLEILSHKSTGAFLSHCGWNSSLESLSRGVPVIGWPLMVDQFCNSKMLDEELGVCVELARGAEDNFEHAHVERIIRLVLDEEKGKEMKEKAIKYAGMMRAAGKEGDEKGSSLRVLDDFIRRMDQGASSGYLLTSCFLFFLIIKKTKNVLVLVSFFRASTRQ